MDNKQLIILCVVILIGVGIICAGVYFGLTNQENTIVINNTAGNNTANVNSTSDTAEVSSSANKSGSNDEYVYSEQKGGYIKASGQYDKDAQGNTIYSYQGSDGVIYERYYDSSGREISSEEYYR